MKGDPQCRDQPAQDAKFISALANEIKARNPMPPPSNETENEWTVRTLKEYVEVVLREHDRRFEQRFQAQESALKSALDAKESDTAGNLSKMAITVAAVSGLLALASVFIRHAP